MTLTIPFRLITLHLSHIFFTEGRTFIVTPERFFHLILSETVTGLTTFVKPTIEKTVVFFSIILHTALQKGQIIHKIS
jgi:hypothetical protein